MSTQLLSEIMSTQLNTTGPASHLDPHQKLRAALPRGGKPMLDPGYASRWSKQTHESLLSIWATIDLHQLLQQCQKLSILWSTIS